MQRGYSKVSFALDKINNYLIQYKNLFLSLYKGGGGGEEVGKI